MLAEKLNGSCTPLVWEHSGNPMVKSPLSYTSIKLPCSILIPEDAAEPRTAGYGVLWEAVASRSGTCTSRVVNDICQALSVGCNATLPSFSPVGTF